MCEREVVYFLPGRRWAEHTLGKSLGDPTVFPSTSSQERKNPGLVPACSESNGTGWALGYGPSTPHIWKERFGQNWYTFTPGLFCNIKSQKESQHDPHRLALCTREAALVREVLMKCHQMGWGSRGVADDSHVPFLQVTSFPCPSAVSGEHWCLHNQTIPAYLKYSHAKSYPQQCILKGRNSRLSVPFQTLWRFFFF